jgi:adenylate kinase family enzyme
VSNEEQIRIELDIVQKVPIEGFILLDFPRTIEHAKAIE